MNGLRWVRPGDGYEPMLDYMFERVEVNGENEIPLYTFLKGACGPTFSQFSRSDRLFYEPLRTGDIAWNFEKFLVDRTGRPVQRYHPHVVDPDHVEMVADIEAVLAAKPPAPEMQPLDFVGQTREGRNVDFQWDIRP